MVNQIEGKPRPRITRRNFLDLSRKVGLPLLGLGLAGCAPTASAARPPEDETGEPSGPIVLDLAAARKENAAFQTIYDGAVELAKNNIYVEGEQVAFDFLVIKLPESLSSVRYHPFLLANETNGDFQEMFMISLGQENEQGKPSMQLTGMVPEDITYEGNRLFTWSIHVDPTSPDPKNPQMLDHPHPVFIYPVDSATLNTLTEAQRDTLMVKFQPYSGGSFKDVPLEQNADYKNINLVVTQNPAQTVIIPTATVEPAAPPTAVPTQTPEPSPTPRPSIESITILSAQMSDVSPFVTDLSNVSRAIDYIQNKNKSQQITVDGAPITITDFTNDYIEQCNRIGLPFWENPSYILDILKPDNSWYSQVFTVTRPESVQQENWYFTTRFLGFGMCFDPTLLKKIGTSSEFSLIPNEQRETLDFSEYPLGYAGFAVRPKSEINGVISPSHQLYVFGMPINKEYRSETIYGPSVSVGLVQDTDYQNARRFGIPYEKLVGTPNTPGLMSDRRLLSTEVGLFFQSMKGIDYKGQMKTYEDLVKGTRIPSSRQLQLKAYQSKLNCIYFPVSLAPILAEYGVDV